MSYDGIFHIPKPSKESTTERDECEFDLTDIEASLLHEIRKAVRHIEEQIRAKKDIPKKRRKIIRSQISAKFGLNPSFITERRHPFLSQFIDEENQRLELMFQAVRREKSDKVHRKTLTQMTTKELIAEVQRLKAIISDSDHEVVLAQIDRIVESELSVGQRRTSMVIESLKLENDRNVRELAQLIEARQALEEELSDEIGRRRALEQELRTLSADESEVDTAERSSEGK